MHRGIKIQMEHLVGEIISIELPGLSDGDRAHSFTCSIMDTTWVKDVKNKKRAKIGRDFKIGNRPTFKEDIEGKKFLVLGTDTETTGSYSLDTYLITRLQNIEDSSEQYKWSVHISSNYQGTSKPNVIIRLDKYSQIARDAYVDGKSYYLLNTEFAKPCKENGYLNYVEVCYIDESNESSGVIHKGIRYMDAGKPMAASAIPKDAELSDLIAPTNKVYYNESEERLYSLSSLILKLFSRAFCRFFLPVLRIIYAYT